MTVLEPAPDSTPATITLTYSSADFNLGPTAGDGTVGADPFSRGGVMSFSYPDGFHDTDKSIAFNFTAVGADPLALVTATVQVDGQEASATYPITIQGAASGPTEAWSQCTATLCLDAPPEGLSGLDGSGGWGYGTDAPVTSTAVGDTLPLTVTVMEPDPDSTAATITLTYSSADFHLDPTASDGSVGTDPFGARGGVMSFSYPGGFHDTAKSISFNFTAVGADPAALVTAAVQVDNQETSETFPIAIEADNRNLLGSIAYYTLTEPGGFTRYAAAQVAPPYSQSSAGPAGPVTLSIGDETGYADNGFYIPLGTLGDLKGYTIDGVGSQFGDNLYFGTNSGDFFLWDSGNVLTGYGATSYGLGPTSSGGSVTVTGSSQFFMISSTNTSCPAGTYTFADLAAACGFSTSTPVALWVGDTDASGTTAPVSTTFTLVETN